MTKEFDTLVFIGRFQPLHKGHEAVIKKGIEKSKEVIVVVGSAFEPRTISNPFTYEERSAMIKASFPDSNVIVVPAENFPYNDNAWVSNIQKSVDRVKSGTTTGLIGHSKDQSSYYLDIFPDWKNHIEVENVDEINATNIRKDLFSCKKFFESANLLSASVCLEMNKILSSGTWWPELKTEYESIQKYKNIWAVAPFPPTFVTTDAVLTQSGYILLIKRGGFPYKDCWALPGGYLEQDISIEQNMIKELREETKLKLPEKVLRGSIKDTKVFDMPNRDPRGRTITHAFYVDLGYPKEGLPKVKGGDDAAEAQWVKLSKVTREVMAFDHYSIIQHFIPSN